MLVLLTHLCAAATFAYVWRGAQFNASWLEVPALDRELPEPLPAVSVVVPARDEARSIEACVRSLCTQRGLPFEVIVVDDRSSDATRDILRTLQREFAHLTVVDGAALPAGFVGKPWALAQGARVARYPWLLFTDADSVHAPFGVASAVWFAQRAGTDALTIATRQELASFWERAILPSVLGLALFASGTLGELNDPGKPDQALANGQYILIARAAYDALGGHEALRNEIVEDVAFARRLKRDGRFRLLIAGGSRIARVRMYRSFLEIWNGFTKNAYAGTEGDARRLVLGMLFMFSMSLLPPLLAFGNWRAGRKVHAVEALTCTLATVASSSWSYRRVGISPWLAVFQPFGTAMFGAIVINSTWRVLSGKGVDWRGRRYLGRE